MSDEAKVFVPIEQETDSRKSRLDEEEATAKKVSKVVETPKQDSAYDQVSDQMEQWTDSREEQESPENAPETDVHMKASVLIINNTFRGKENARTGADVDGINMEKLWKDHLGCELYDGQVQEDKTADEMLKMLGDMTKRGRREYNYVAVVIMTHGGVVSVDIPSTGLQKPSEKKIQRPEYVIYGNDMVPIAVDRVIEMFNNKNAPDHLDVPKIMLFQCCRGGKKDGEIVSIDALGYEEIDGVCVKRVYLEKGIEVLVPTTSDILVAYPTQQEYEAYRSLIEGSWFIQAVTKIFIEHADKEHVLDLLTKVNAWMAQKVGYIEEKAEANRVTFVKCKAMSCFESSLTKKVYLLPQRQTQNN